MPGYTTTQIEIPVSPIEQPINPTIGEYTVTLNENYFDAVEETQPTVLIIVPSLRINAAKRLIKEFTETNDDINYLLVFACPFNITGHKTTFVKTPNPLAIEDQLKGCGSVWATNVVLERYSAPYIMYFSDDVSPTVGMLRRAIDMIDLDEDRDTTLFSFNMMQSNGRQIGPFGAYGKLYACYGILTRSLLKRLIQNTTIEELGNREDIVFLMEETRLFDNRFQYSWADIDLSLRVWELPRGKVELMYNNYVIPKQIEDDVYAYHRQSKIWNQDVETFLSIWHEKLGAGYERNTDIINRKLEP